MVEILHAYRARNLARARGDTGAAASAHHHLMVLLDRLGSAGARTRPESSKHLGRGSLAP